MCYSKSEKILMYMKSKVYTVLFVDSFLGVVFFYAKMLDYILCLGFILNLSFFKLT